MEGAKSALNNYIESDVNRFNAMVADYNSRCRSFRYHSGTLESARRDIESYWSQLHSEGQKRFALSSTNSQSQPEPTSRESASPTSRGIPQNAHLNYYGTDWECNRGYFKYGNECRFVQIPPNGKLTYLGNDWECNRGYFKYGNECRFVQIPPNGKLTYLGNDWECNRGYFKYGNECRFVQIPPNGKLTYLGNDWECNRGYFKYGNECRFVQIPPNGKLTYLGNDWECERGYQKLGDTCASVFTQ